MLNYFSNLYQNFLDAYQGKAKVGQKRSSKWPTVRDKFLKRNPKCAVCNTKKEIEAHHVYPFHLFPQFELDQSNLISLCRDHHFWVGHLGSWKSYNAICREDAETWRNKIKNRP